jgi:hypothetical protein
MVSPLRLRSLPIGKVRRYPRAVHFSPDQAQPSGLGPTNPEKNSVPSDIQNKMSRLLRQSVLKNSLF